MTNLKIRELKVGLIKFLDGNELPAEVKRMVLAEVLEDATNKADNAIMAEINQSERSECNAESVQPNQLGELSKREYSTE